MEVLCNLTAEQAALYQAVVDDMLERIDDSEGIERRGLVLATMTKLKQVCNHPAHFLRDGSRLAGRSGKLARLDEILDEVLAGGREGAAVHPVRRVRRAAARPPGRRGSAARCCSCTAAWPRPARDAMVARFQADDAGSPPLFVLSLKAGGTGLTLTAANHVVHVDRWWNPAVEDQATDRAFRIGQRRDVQVRKFVCAGTLEEKIADDDRATSAAWPRKIVGTGEQWLTELSTGSCATCSRSRPGRWSSERPGWYPPSRPRRRSRAGSRRAAARGAIGETWWSRAVPRRAGVVRHRRPADPRPELRPRRAR